MPAMRQRIFGLENEYGLIFSPNGRIYLPMEKVLGYIFEGLIPNSWPSNAFLVNTSVDEGYPNTFIQAWLRGVPVLSLEVDPDDVIHENGLGVVEPDLDALLQQISDLVRKPRTYADISGRAARYAARHHSLQTMADGFLSAIGE